jgi:MoaA/NifB/PqqE/SkfB family radical SAM enzyme/surfactin synthase thioesterase subunit
MMPVGVVLVHGYSGLPADLQPLSSALSEDWGAEAVFRIALPGHEEGRVPPFQSELFVAEIDRAVTAVRNSHRKTVLIGHSTGGTLLLAWMAMHGVFPDLLVLAATPRSIGIDYLERWQRHRAETTQIPFSSVARLVSLVNATGRRHWSGGFPVLILHGEEDGLVPAAAARAWEEGAFSGPVRTVLTPGGGHHLFKGAGAELAVEVVRRAVADLAAPDPGTERIVSELGAVEPESIRFLKASPGSARHLAACPSGRALIGAAPELSEVVRHEPVFANIEITTRCNLACSYCARAGLKPREQDMPLERFRRLLDLLPHAYRITLVGLGEPLLHPQVVEMVAIASALGRRVALVTNAMALDPRRSAALLAAGLDSIAFSLDAVDRGVAARTRPGIDLERVLSNIRAFTALAAGEERPVSTAVFAAVSSETVSHLTELTEAVAGLGVAVLMLSDLNFAENVGGSLWKNSGPETVSAVRKGIVAAFGRRLPVLSVHGLEEFGLARRYHRCLLFPPEQLCRRSVRRTWCLSPWQTLAVDVEGNALLCDCQPGKVLGNLLTQPLAEVWNGAAMVSHRRAMAGQYPPPACSICPRF